MFIAQSTLETWMDAGSVEMEDQQITVIHSQQVYRLEPAVRVLSAVPTEENQQPKVDQLIGKVIPERGILELGGELMGASVLVGDAALEVEAGYIGQLEG